MLVDRTPEELEAIQKKYATKGHVMEAWALIYAKARNMRHYVEHILSTLDLVLPRREGLPFVNDAKTLAHLQARARNRFRDNKRLIGAEVGEKVRKLIDEHIISLGINPIALRWSTRPIMSPYSVSSSRRKEK